MIMERTERAFTLVELLVVVAIIGLLSALAYSGLTGGNKSEATRSASFDLRSALQNSAEAALASRLNSAGAPADYYGVKIINSVAYAIFRVETGSTLAQAVLSAQTALPSGVTLTVSPANLAAVAFKKNSAAVTLWDEGGHAISPDSDGSVTLTIKGVGIYPIKVYAATGRIE